MCIFIPSFHYFKLLVRYFPYFIFCQEAGQEGLHILIINTHKVVADIPIPITDTIVTIPIQGTGKRAITPTPAEESNLCFLPHIFNFKSLQSGRRNTETDYRHQRHHANPRHRQTSQKANSRRGEQSDMRLD